MVAQASEQENCSFITSQGGKEEVRGEGRGRGGNEEREGQGEGEGWPS